MVWVVSAEDDMDLSLISKLQCPPNQSYSSMLSVVVNAVVVVDDVVVVAQ